jgi:hypothetical protein
VSAPNLELADITADPAILALPGLAGLGTAAASSQRPGPGAGRASSWWTSITSRRSTTCTATRRWAHLADPIRHHHERVDGAGYPGGLFGPTIPLESRILADEVVDTRERVLLPVALSAGTA